MTPKRLAPFAAAAALTTLLLSCPQAIDDEFQKTIEDEVAAANAEPRRVTVTSDGNGITTPNAGADVKDGIPFELSATAFGSHVFGSWEQVSGTGTVVFERPNAEVTKARVKGGDAVIRANFTARPKVDYSTPFGTDRYTNSSITIFFTKVMDTDTINKSTVQLIWQDNTLVEGTVEYDGVSRIARFIPDDDLASNKIYRIKVLRTACDSQGVMMEDDYQNSFSTGNGRDDDPPNLSYKYNVTNPSAVASRTIHFSEIDASDGSGIDPVLRVVEIVGAQEYTCDLALNTDFDYELQGDEGTRSLKLVAIDSVGNPSTNSPASVILDCTAPDGTFAINDGANNPRDYINSTSVTLASSLSDGAGVGMAGAEMSWSADNGVTWTTYESYASARAITLPGLDGARMILLRVRDSLGNERQFEDGIALDRVAPTVTNFKLDSGAAYSTDLTLNASYVASDGSGVGLEQMRFSQNGGSSWSPWESFATSKAFAAASEGALDVRFEVRDKAGNTCAAPGSAAIFVDTASPTLVSYAINGSAEYTPSISVTVSSTITDPNGASGSGIKQICFSNNGSTWTAWESFVGGALSKPYDLLTGDGTKKVYIRVQDNAGNLSSTSDSIILDASPPTASITSIPNTSAPDPNYVRGTRIVNADASDARGIEKVEFYIGGTLRGTDTTSPYAFSWDTTSYTTGTSYTVYVKSYDVAGNITTSSTWSRTVDNVPPDAASISNITYLGSNANYIKGTPNISATANDVVGMARVDFFVDGTDIASDLTAAYSCTWNSTTVSDGELDFYCVAVDKAGNMTQSTSVLRTIDNTPPVVSLTSPASGSSVAGPTVTCEATATDANIEKVSFDSSGAIATDTTSPYSATWNVTALAEGSRNVVATAYDFAGNYAQSLAPVTVDNYAIAYSQTLTDGGTVPGSANYGNFSSIAAYSSSILYIAYLDATNSDIDMKKTTNGGSSWTDCPSISISGRKVAIDVDTGNMVHAAFVSSSGALLYCKSTAGGASWGSAVQITATGELSISEKPAIAVYGEGATATVHLAWRKASADNGVFYAYSTDGGATFSSPVTLATSGTVTYGPPSMSLAGFCNISFASSTGILYYRARHVQTGAAIASTPAGSGFTLLPAIGSTLPPLTGDDLVSIVCKTTGGALASRYTTDKGATWTSGTVLTSPAATQAAVAATRYMSGMLFTDKYSVVHYDTALGLRISSSRDGVTWYTYTLNTQTAIDQMLSVTMRDQYAYIAYYDSTNQKLKFIRAIVNF